VQIKRDFKTQKTQKSTKGFLQKSRN